MSTPVDSYQSYKGLPTLAGLASIADASRPGLGIEARRALPGSSAITTPLSGCTRS
jgi:hypothetical protein